MIIPPIINQPRSPEAGGSGLRGSASGGGTLTFAAFSSPTSISTLIVSSFRVSHFHLPYRTGEVGAGLIEAVQCGNLVVVGAGKRILRGNHFNIVCHASSEAVARLVHFFLRQLHAQVGNLHFAACRFEIQEGGLYVQRYRVPQLPLLLLFFWQPGAGLCASRADPPAG